MDEAGENQIDYWLGHVPYNCAVSIIEERRGTGEPVTDEIYNLDEFVADRYF